MIGRQDPVKPFELIRWARAQATHHNLRLLEAHVLLLLATYANGDATAWPSIKTLALGSGLRPTKDGRNSAVSAAIARLEELHLVWTKQGGHGHPAKRELLFNPALPSGYAEGMHGGYSRQPSAEPEGCLAPPARQPSGLTDAAFRLGGPEGPANDQGTANYELPNKNGQRSLPATRKASHPSPRTKNKQPFSALDALGDMPGLTEEQRADIHALGGRFAAFNRNAGAAA